ncbi:MAG TPA: FAD-binding oxidoreductase [Acetobacteraceae bacterium]|jgi:glycine/D-amino acid oxidase-like deaminating enzyme|nr:FAD-binding oxidoreductase [Acetobacteraceae bacterium]
MIDAAECVVIGSGALGSSVAFHLAKSGKQVALLDKHALGSQTSPRAAGLTSQARGTDLMTQLAKRAVRKIEGFEAETGEKIVFHQPGALKIARLPEHVEQLEREVSRGRRMGTGIEMISPEEARAKNPFLHTTGILGVIYSPTDLYLEPSQIPNLYARAAERLGVTMLPHTLVTGIATRNGAVSTVETEHGRIRCETVVDAAGAWLRAVAALSGAKVAVVPTRHQLLITEPIDGVDATQPITRIIDVNVYARPDEGGLMLGGYEQTPLQYDAQTLPARFDIADLPLDLGVLRGFADSVREQLPVFQRVPEEIGLRVHRGGLPTMTADGEHTVGLVPGVRGLYVAGGCCVGGLSIAPAIGEALAAWITDGAPPMDLSPLAPGRESAMDEDALKAACRLQYAHHYWEHVPRS